MFALEYDDRVRARLVLEERRALELSDGAGTVFGKACARVVLADSCRCSFVVLVMGEQGYRFVSVPTFIGHCANFSSSHRVAERCSKGLQVREEVTLVAGRQIPTKFFAAGRMSVPERTDYAFSGTREAKRCWQLVEGPRNKPYSNVLSYILSSPD